MFTVAMYVGEVVPVVGAGFQTHNVKYCVFN